MADCMTTYSGKRFSILEVRAEQIVIEDIAHALSLLCRGNGHVKYFYSVGQHCINCANLAKAKGYGVELQLACLLHDASEAYMADVIRPIKKSLPLYQEIEQQVLQIIFDKYGIGKYVNCREVKEIDDVLCKYDLKYLLGMQEIEVPYLEMEPDITCYQPMIMEAMYLQHFEELIKGVAR